MRPCSRQLRPRAEFERGCYEKIYCDRPTALEAEKKRVEGGKLHFEVLDEVAEAKDDELGDPDALEFGLCQRHSMIIYLFGSLTR